MCLPAAPLLIASTALSAGSALVGGLQSAAASRYSAKIGQANADRDRAAAQDALKRGGIEEQRQYQRNAQRMGMQRASMAASGLDLGFGTPMDIIEDTARVGWEDAQTVRENAAREATGYEIRAWNADAQASADKANAKAAVWSAALDAGGTVLSGAQQYRKLKAPGRVTASSGASAY